MKRLLFILFLGSVAYGQSPTSLVSYRKLYSVADSLGGVILHVSDTGGVFTSLLDRSRHIGTQAATTITTDATHRFVTDVEKNVFSLKLGPGDSALMLAPYRDGLNARTTALVAHTARTDNPHSVTKSQVGLGNVANLDSSTLKSNVWPALNGRSLIGHTHTSSDVGLGNVANLDSATLKQNIWPALNGRSLVGHTHTKSEVGLSNVINTDTARVDIAAALNGRSLVGHTHTAAQVGLGNVQNFDTATIKQNTWPALNARSLVGHTHTKSEVGLSNVVNTDTARTDIANALNARTVSIATKEPAITATSSADYYRGDKTFQPLNKAAVGLSNVVNTDTARTDIANALNARSVLIASNTTTTAGKADTVTNGVPRRVLYVTTAKSWTGSTAEVEVYRDTIKLARNPFGPNTSIHIPFLVSASSNTNTKTFRLKINGTTVSTLTLNQTTLTLSRWYFWMSNRNSLSSQIVGGSPTQNTNTGWAVATTGSPQTYSLTTSGDVIITATVQLNTGTDAVALEQMDVIMYP